jgi:hypothetical protein
MSSTHDYFISVVRAASEQLYADIRTSVRMRRGCIIDAG